MDTEIQSLKDLIAEKVGKELVSLIPPDQWDRLIQQQIQEFQTKQLPIIVQEILSKKLKEELAAHIGKNQLWDSYTGKYCNELVKEALEKSAPLIFSAMLTPVMSGFLEDLRNRLYR